MRYLILALLALTLSTEANAQTEKRKPSNHETDKQSEDNARLQKRLDALEDLLSSVRWEPENTGLDAQQRKAEAEWEKWMLATRNELKSYVRNLDRYLKRKVKDAEQVKSFDMQYLNLQEKMQDESRRFTMLSNISKTKHDTVKNSIGNIR
jgi:predicted RNase H-like nuclease (RuvC/YqgF family)